MAQVDKVHNKMQSPNNCCPPTEECESNGDERGAGICMQSANGCGQGAWDQDSFSGKVLEALVSIKRTESRRM